MKTAAPEKKSSKTLKGQLFGAISMMLVASIALGTSTYAWFVNNQTVEVKNMQLQVDTSTSLLVAVRKTDNTKNTTYKTTISNDDITGKAGLTDVADWANMFTNPLKPVSISTDGLAVGTADPTFFMSNGHVSANALLDEFKAINFSATADTLDAVGQGAVKRIPLKFLSSVSKLPVYFGGLNTASTPAAIASISEFISKGTDPDGKLTEAELTAQAAAISKVLRIAVVPRVSDGYDAGDLATSIFQFDDGTVKAFAGSQYNTDYQYTTTVDGTPTTAANINTEIAKLQKEEAGLYAAISALNVTAGTQAEKARILTVKPLNATLPAKAATDYLATVTPVADGVPTVTKPTGTDTPLFTLVADKPLDVDVYIWLEGSDQDCISALSQYMFNIRLPFAAVAPTNP